MFRVIAFVSVGLVLGFLLGGIGPQRELSKVSLELKQLKRQVDRLDRPNPLRELLPALANARSTRVSARSTALPARAASGQPTPADDERAPTQADPGSRPSGALILRGSDDDVSAGSAASRTRANADNGEPTPTDGEEGAANDDDRTDRPRGFRSLNLSRFDELSAAQAMRFAASRAALIEQADLSDEETVAVDQTVKKMNDDLSGYGEEILSQASSEEPPSPSQALGLGHDVSGIMYEGQKQLEGIVGKRANGVEPEALEIWNYVDMQRLRPAAEKYLPAGEPKPGAAPAPAATGPSTPDTQDEE